MIGKNIKFSNFIFQNKISNKKKILSIFKKLIKEKNEIVLSLGKNYKDSYSKKKIDKIKKKKN